LNLADLLVPGSQLAPNLLQSLGVLLHFPPDLFLKLLQHLLLSLQLLFQLLGFSSQLWDSSLKLLSVCAASLQGQARCKLLNFEL
jgi:hypothetical protein